MKKYVLVCLALMAFSSHSHATSIQVDMEALSNSTTGYITWNDPKGKAHTEDVYITQFQMKYQPVSGSSRTIYTYCVDLNDDEKSKSPYSVQQVSLTSAFGKTNGNEIGYLYAKYGYMNLAGKSTQDAGLQVALWDLSEDPRNHHPASFTKISGTSSYGDSSFSVKGVSAAIVSEANSLLKEASDKVSKGYQVGDSILLLQNTSGSKNPQQNVLFRNSPEPSPLLLLGILGGILGCCALVQRLRAKTSLNYPGKW